MDILKVKRGEVNPFALINDTENKVKYYMVDKKLMEYEYWAFHVTSIYLHLLNYIANAIRYVSRTEKRRFSDLICEIIY